MPWTMTELLLQVRNTKAPHASSSPSGYAFETTKEQTRHVLYQGLSGGRPDGHIHELYWDKPGWHWTDLTNDSGAPLALTGPSGYGFVTEDTQHAIYAGKTSSANLCEIWWKSGNKGFTRISDIDQQHLVTDVPPSGSIIFDSQYVFIHGGSDGLIWGAQRDPNADHWQLIKLPSTVATIAGTTACAVGTTNPSKLHVFHFDANGRMLHLVRTVSGGSFVWGEDFIQVPGITIPPARDFPNAIVPRSGWLRVHYNGLNEPRLDESGLHVLLNTGDSWSHENMTADRGLPPLLPEFAK